MPCTSHIHMPSSYILVSLHDCNKRHRQSGAHKNHVPLVIESPPRPILHSIFIPFCSPTTILCLRDRSFNSHLLCPSSRILFISNCFLLCQLNLSPKFLF